MTRIWWTECSEPYRAAPRETHRVSSFSLPLLGQGTVGPERAQPCLCPRSSLPWGRAPPLLFQAPSPPSSPPLQRLQRGKGGWDSLPAGRFSSSSERTGNSLRVLLLYPLSELSKEWAASNLTKNSLFTVKMLMALLLNPAGARGIRHQTPVISAHPETAVAEKHTSQPLRTSKRL